MKAKTDPLRVGNPPERPLMVFDGDCGFCRYWIERWRGATGGNVDYEPSQKVAALYPEIPAGDFENAVQFIEPDGCVTSGVDAVFRALEYAPQKNGLLEFLRGVPGFDAVADAIYRVVASNRPFFSFLTRVFFERKENRPSYSVARWMFMRLLGAIYLVAFISLLMQIGGLAGKHGIAPASDFLQMVKENTGNERYWLVPTICWFNASDPFLVSMCIAGAVLSCAVILNFFPGLCLFLLWALFLSLVVVCEPFLDFQWDCLLLQAGLLAAFLVPPVFRPDWKNESGGSRLARWLLLWLLFCLMFESGVVKLTSGDDSWWNLTALTYHYQTQPLPIWTSWYVNQTPLWLESFTVILMFVIELVVPFSIFGPRIVRRVGAGVMIAFQLFIACTGNYCFFNLLTIALCLLMLDDAAWPQWLRERLRASPDSKRKRARWWILAVAPVGAVDVFLSRMQLSQAFEKEPVSWPPKMEWIEENLSHLRTFNGYGLFRVMTRARPEIIVEGSNDGQTWLPYEFKWKPGDVNRRPGLVAPFQPRLDWQMWFAALGDYRQNRWFIIFLQRLLEGSPEVLQLMGSNPFPAAPPRYIRASLYDYKFTRSGENTQAWWERKYLRALLSGAIVVRAAKSGAIDRLATVPSASRLLHHVDADARGAGVDHVELACGCVAYIDNSALDIRAAVGDAHHDTA